MFRNPLLPGEAFRLCRISRGERGRFLCVRPPETSVSELIGNALFYVPSACPPPFLRGKEDRTIFSRLPALSVGVGLIRVVVGWDASKAQPRVAKGCSGFPEHMCVHFCDPSFSCQTAGSFLLDHPESPEKGAEK